jgi:hypothetical protein
MEVKGFKKGDGIVPFLVPVKRRKNETVKEAEEGDW